MEGVYVRFRDLSGGSQQYNMVTVLSPAASGYTVPNLKKYTKYEFFLVPFYRTVEGQPSNSMSVQTLQDGEYTRPQYIAPSICCLVMTSAESRVNIKLNSSDLSNRDSLPMGFIWSSTWMKVTALPYNRLCRIGLRHPVHLAGRCRFHPCRTLHMNSISMGSESRSLR